MKQPHFNNIKTEYTISTMKGNNGRKYKEFHDELPIVETNLETYDDTDFLHPANGSERWIEYIENITDNYEKTFSDENKLELARRHLSGRILGAFRDNRTKINSPADLREVVSRSQGGNPLYGALSELTKLHSTGNAAQESPKPSQENTSTKTSFCEYL